jgi:hypothetical protein
VEVSPGIKHEERIMAKVLRGQRDLIDYAEIQHQDIETELRQALAERDRERAAVDELIRQLRAALKAWMDETEAPVAGRPRHVKLWERSRELLGL